MGKSDKFDLLLDLVFFNKMRAYCDNNMTDNDSSNVTTVTVGWEFFYFKRIWLML